MAKNATWDADELFSGGGGRRSSAPILSSDIPIVNFPISTSLPELPRSNNKTLTRRLGSEPILNGARSTRQPFVRKPGRRSDPRMAKAVDAKLECPELSLLEALQRGGFVFPNLDLPLKKVVDKEKVSLLQRKNQLLRRLRSIKKQEAEEAGDVGGPPLTGKTQSLMSQLLEHSHSAQETLKSSIAKKAALKKSRPSQQRLLDCKMSSSSKSDQCEKKVPVKAPVIPPMTPVSRPETVRSSESSTKIDSPRADLASLEPRPFPVLGQFDSASFAWGQSPNPEVNNLPSGATTKPSTRMERKDSFYEQIMQLPGLGDVGKYDMLTVCTENW